MPHGPRPRPSRRVASVLALVVVLSVAPVATGVPLGTDPGDPAVADGDPGRIAPTAAGASTVGTAPAESGPGATHQARGSAVGTATGAARENATLVGTVSEPDGDPAGGARVVAVNTSVNAHRLVDDPEWWTWRDGLGSEELDEVGDPPLAPGVYATETGPDGGYSLSLPPGEYTVWAYGTEADGAGGWYYSGFRQVTLSPGERRRASLNGTSAPSVVPRPPDYLIRVGAATARPGETVGIPVSASLVEVYALDRPANLTGGRVTLTFDPSVAEVVGVEGVDGRVTDRRIDDGNGTVEFAVEGVDPAAEATLANVTFRVTANESTATHLVLDEPTALETTDGTVGFDEDPPRIAPGVGAITVLPDPAPDPVTRADRDGDGAISTPELLGAIRDWASGEYTTGELAVVIRAWARTG